MDKKVAKERIEKLKKVIDRHRYLYHVLDKQEISDAALDSLKKELFDLEQQYPDLITKDSPTQRVGGEPLKEFKKISHNKPMLSLNDVFSREDFEDWRERISKLVDKENKNKIDFYCELKIDGLAIELEYENGILKTGSTRGDGLIGEDITQNLKTVEAIPLALQEFKIQNSKFKIPERLVVRGEVFISKNEFEKINESQKEKGLPLYANPRNIAAGSVRQLNPRVTASRKLDSFAYDIVSPPTNFWKKELEMCMKKPEFQKLVGGKGIETHEAKHFILHQLGFKTNKNNRFSKSAGDVFDFYDKTLKLRDKLPYEIDGIVIIVNNNKTFENLGVVGKAPRGAVAFKFPQNQATTQVLDIKLQVGRTGAITPVAILRPAKVSGITISRATLHNEDEIKRLDLKIGDTVIVGRAGDVIPDIVKVLPELRTGKEKSFVVPKFCPSCKSKLEKSESKALWRCPNPKCFARTRRKFYHFVSRAAFNIEGLGPKIIDRLLDEGLVQDPSDLFGLKEGDINQLERFGEKSAENLVHSIQGKKQITLSRFIYALGIRNIGQETAMDLASNFGSIDKLKNSSLLDLENILNIGPIVAKSIYGWFQDKSNLKFLDKLFLSGVKIISQKQVVKSGNLSGKVFVLTGTLESMDRNSAKEKIRSLGGRVAESVSNKTSFVIVGREPGSKLEKARKLGVKILSENEFIHEISN